MTALSSPESLGILKAEALAQILGCSLFTVEDRARKGELPGLKFGDEGWIFPIQATMQVLNEKALRDAETRRSGTRKPTALLKEVKQKRPPPLPSLQSM